MQSPACERQGRLSGRLFCCARCDGRHGARKAWLLRFQVNKQRRVIGLGSYPAVSLANARAKAADVHALIDKGIDPFEARKAAEQAGRPVPTFAEIANLVSDDAQADRRTRRSGINGPGISANRQFSPQGPLGVRNEMRRLSAASTANRG
jgi:Arm DNA-binding domain